MASGLGNSQHARITVEGGKQRKRESLLALPFVFDDPDQDSIPDFSRLPLCSSRSQARSKGETDQLGVKKTVEQKPASRHANHSLTLTNSHDHPGTDPATFIKNSA